MTDILLVIPPGWSSVSWDDMAKISLDLQSAKAMSNDLQGLEVMFKSAGILAETESLGDVKVIETMQDAYFLILKA